MTLTGAAAKPAESDCRVITKMKKLKSIGDLVFSVIRYEAVIFVVLLVVIFILFQ
jgi:hypothetical protein